MYPTITFIVVFSVI